MDVSPVSTLRTPIDDGKHVVVSPVEKAVAYYPDEKICMPVADGIEVRQATSDVHPQLAPPKYADSELPERAYSPPFWKRHLLWILAGVVLLIILIGILVGLVVATHKGKSELSHKAVVTNNTRNSVASSGLFLKDGTTWNMHLFSQNETGGINLQVSLEGGGFQPSQKVPLTITPKMGSPLSATAEQDEDTGVVMINLFYLSGIHNITMSAITCASGSAKCNTISNCLLPTDVPANDNTGLTAVNVSNQKDWRVYYHDNKGFISQLQGNESGFNTGERIGGSGLNASSIAAVNVNSTTNNVNLFYVDSSSQNLYNMQFTDGAWTTPLPISASPFSTWNPLSGLGAAYSVGQDQLHVYFTGTDTSIYEYVGNNASQTTNTKWINQPSRQRIWANADYAGADVTALGWTDQVRFWQVSQGKMVQGALNNATWTETFVA
ncbi:uncharacterized protein PAC_06834 [Phialocephala subalpina]|uniref:Fucose-specific lectin n=1 Tax=Phialocephala subalpina TaxID=576137 RepID=A0A1L7WVY2_9HELO|nr:uncharacterized protein PAC_06834 [Phialocephala subalpina]